MCLLLHPMQCQNLQHSPFWHSSFLHHCHLPHSCTYSHLEFTSQCVSVSQLSSCLLILDVILALLIFPTASQSVTSHTQFHSKESKNITPCLNSFPYSQKETSLPMYWRQCPPRLDTIMLPFSLHWSSSSSKSATTKHSKKSGLRSPLSLEMMTAHVLIWDI